MKLVVMLVGILGGLVLMSFPGGIDRAKPSWWKLLTVLSMALTCIVGLFPPLAGSITDVVIQHRADSLKVVPALVRIVPNTAGTAPGIVTLTDARDQRVVVDGRPSPDVSAELAGLPQGADLVLGLKRMDRDNIFEISSVVAVKPLITMPYIVGLEERARIMFFHVPLSWIATIAYFLTMLASIRHLRTRRLEHDDVAVVTAALGTLFTVLATLTGAVWAKFNWGTFWNWDPRQTSIMLLMLIYAAYFLLRSTIEDPDRRARLGSVYAIIAFPTVPFLIFVLPRLLPGLHPGSADDTNLGPLLSPRSDAINPIKTAVFGLALFSFTLVFAWLVNIRLRLARMERRRAFRSEAA
ncbi:MAG: cytochrome c biogenesis protein [Bacteroidota bacterium]|jgi:heme exporter protein C